MTLTPTPVWEARRTDDSRLVEEALRSAGFPKADAYRYNPASTRVRVIDTRFEGLSDERREEMVDPTLKTLPEAIQADIITLYTFAPSELNEPTPKAFRSFFMNMEFDNPTPSML